MRVDGDGKAAARSPRPHPQPQSRLDLHFPALDVIVRTYDHWHLHHRQDISFSLISSPFIAVEKPPNHAALSLDINIPTYSLCSDLAVDQRPQPRSQPVPPPPRFDASYQLRQRTQELLDDLPFLSSRCDSRLRVLHAATSCCRDSRLPAYAPHLPATVPGSP
ncbi:hypothetical protein AURDEDRAFT_114462 [Auricularia subglabra TFB-10046 SS5]|nr:hypothetical protein AURDEDRAFT_114462 [Auricularia subglabra TFB-10046 SS5]